MQIEYIDLSKGKVNIFTSFALALKCIAEKKNG